MIISLLLIISLLSTCYCSPWDWGQVTIGGGGYVLGLVVHPTTPDLLYARSDVGGFFRYDFPSKRWIPLVDMFGPDMKNFYGGESIAIDPSDPNIVYVAAGMYSYWGTGDVLKSYDRGQTWHFTNLSILMGGNEDKRWAGERLVVSPKNSQLVLFGSRYDGLWVSHTGGGNWSRSSLSNGTYGYGVHFVTFDSVNDVIYAGVEGEGVYLSGDNGNSWKLLSGSPTAPLRATITPGTNSLLVSSYSGLWKFDGEWTNISPDPKLVYSGITVHPTNPNFIVVAEQTPSFSDAIFRSYDGGKTWENIYSNANITDQPVWWPDNWFSAATSVVLIDPIDTSRAYLTTWFGTYFCDNISSPITTWYTSEKGHEEVFAITMHVPSNGGIFMVGTADVTGFRIPFSSFDDFPTTYFNPNSSSDFQLQDTTSIDSAFGNPNFVARAGTRQYTNPPSGAAGYSTNNGLTWTNFPIYPVENNYALGGIIAVSANGESIVWWPFQAKAYVTKDLGHSWLAVEGSPYNNASCCHATPAVDVNGLGIDAAYPTLLQSDKVNSSVFYMFSDGEFLLSTDGGASFEKTFSIPTNNVAANLILQAAPSSAGEVWISLGGVGGLWRSSNYGYSFTQVTSVSSSLLFCFGKGASNSIPSVYLMGTVNGVQSVFISSDLGSTWEDIGDPNMRMGDNPWSMTADPTTYGQVFVGTLGRGVFVGHV